MKLRINENLAVLLIVLCGICIGLISTNFMVAETPLNQTDSIYEYPKSAQSENYTLNMYYFILESCEDCINKRDNIVRPFNLTYSDINYSEYRLDNASSFEYLRAVSILNESGLNYPGVMVIFETEYGSYAILSEDISLEVLDEVYYKLKSDPEGYQGWIFYEVSEEPFNLIEAFLNGILSGVNPCVILITIVLGVSIFGSQDKKLIFSNMLTFIFGLMVGYFVIGILFYFIIDLTSSLLGLGMVKFIVGIPLIVLGLWYIVDAWNSKSLLFTTPDSIKNLLKRMTEKNSASWSFLLGIVFTLLKSACIAAFMLTLILKMSIYNVQTIVIFPAMALFSTGLVIPVGSVLILLAIGISSEKINDFREKYKSWLRIISGIIIIITTIITLI